MRWALALSVTLHASLGALWLSGPAGRPADDVPLIEVELVQQAPMQEGGTPIEAVAAPAARPEQPPPEPQAEAQTPAPAPPTRHEAAAAVNLGSGPRDLEALAVTGENVVPPAPDSLYRNRPPSYPADAARAGAQGTVQLVIHVSAGGFPEQVVVAGSSGHPSLDRAARSAVLLWRFRPARAGGAPVPFDYVMNIRFALGDR
ncbi:MAG TPA: energy transducer TonB [Acetobacteraceae bacterium]|nr:energy transducer TonB [Acetobacteraceae bacterium]